MNRRIVLGSWLLVAGLLLVIDSQLILPQLFGDFTGLVGVSLVAAGVVLLVWRVNRRLVGGSVLIILALLLVGAGTLSGWGIAEDQPGLGQALPFWVVAAVVSWLGVRSIRTALQERHLSGVPANRVRVSRKVWFFFAAVLLGVGVWQATGQLLEMKYFDGPTVACGTAVAMLFAGEYHEDVGGPIDPHPSNEMRRIGRPNENGDIIFKWEIIPDSSTEAFCLSLGREAAWEAFGLVMVSVVLFLLGVRFGEPGHQT